MAATGEQVLADATVMLDEIYDMTPIEQQNRFGATAQHITKQTTWAGGALHKKIRSQVLTNTRVSASLEGVLPDATKIDAKDITIEESHLRRLAFSIARSLPASYELDGSKDSLYNIATELATQSFQAVGEKRNQLLNGSATCRKAQVAVKYDEDGTAWTPGELDAFLKIDNGSISNFHQGEILDIRTVATDVIRVVVTVDDVIHNTVWRGLSIGPGLVVSRHAAYSGALDANLNNVADNDELVAHSETTTDGYHASFESLCDLTATPGAYFGQTRTAKGNDYLVPYGRDYLVETGALVNLDVETHFGTFADVMGLLFGPARLQRQAIGFTLTEALVCQAQPALVNEMAREIGEASKMFQREIAAKLDAATRKELIAVGGWSGSVLFHPNLPAIVLQPEALAPANTIRIFEPSAWEWIRMGRAQPEWIPGGTVGRIWHPRQDPTTGNLTVDFQAGGYAIEAPFCSQPKLNYTIKGVKSSL